ncbi:hypothetical protein SNN83_004395 [Cronobacter malonaticus]|nr:hypothetical protein [Cronobacter malonaticus]
MQEKIVHPNVEAIAFDDYASSALVVKDCIHNGVKYEFYGVQWYEIRACARQDLLMRIDNFERSPCPPVPISDVIAVHVPERNAVVLKGLKSGPHDYDFSYQQWDVICRVSSNELYGRLKSHVRSRKQTH